MDSLTTTEQSRLKKCEAIINMGKTSFIAVGDACREIKEDKLYRQTYDSWADYCTKRWGWTRQWVNRIENSSAVAKALPADLSPMVDNERIARAISDVPKEHRAAVARAAANNGEITVASVRRAAEEVMIDAVELDSEGFPIPPSLIPLWNRSPEIQELLTSITRISSALKKAQVDKDPLFAGCLFAPALANLTQAYTSIKAVKPYAVCTCEKKGGCRICNGRGLLGKFGWETFVPKEDKAARLKSLKT